MPMPEECGSYFRRLAALRRLPTLPTLSRIARLFVGVALALSLGGGAGVSAESSQSNTPLDPTTLRAEYDRARQDYTAGKTEDAYNRLQSVARRGPQSSTIDYAIGTSAAKLGKTGEALARLEGSLIHAPRNRDARHNWRLVHGNLPPGARTERAYIQQWYGFLSTAEWFLLTSFIYIAGWSMLAVGVLNRGADRQPGMLRGATAFLVGSVALTVVFLTSRTHALDGAYVSSTGHAEVRSGPSSSFRQVQQAQPGTRFRLDSPHPDAGYYAVKMADGSVGYVNTESLSLVVPR